MITVRERQRMIEFLRSGIESSGRQRILCPNSLLSDDQDAFLSKAKEGSLDGILIQESADTPESPTIYLAAHHANRTVKGLNRVMEAARSNGIVVAHVFYGNGEDYFVRRTAAEGSKKFSTLKKYSQTELKDMLKLRPMEREVLDWVEPMDELAYYQPPTEEVSEGIRLFTMKNVYPDFSHISLSSPKRRHLQSEDEPYRVYKIPKGYKKLCSPLVVEHIGGNVGAIRAPIVATDPPRDYKGEQLFFVE